MSLPYPATSLNTRMGGALSRVSPDATAYGSREARWFVNCDSAWADPAEDERHVSFTREAASRLRSISDGGMYLHYGSPEPEDQVKAAYGDNYERLVEIKERWDPTNLFRMNQNIRPRAGAGA